MNRVYQQRKQRMLERKQQHWGQPLFPNKQYYDKQYYEKIAKEIHDGQA